MDDEFEEEVLGEKPKKKPKLAKSVRKQGRPRGGRITIAQARIDALDDVTYEAKLARILGIGRGTLAQWIDPESKNPLPFKSEDCHRLFRKNEVMKWLKETERWTEREEYR